MLNYKKLKAFTKMYQKIIILQPIHYQLFINIKANQKFDKQ